MPLPLRARQAWEAMPAPQRVNRVLYGLAFVSMLGLLAELGIGDRSGDVDVAGDPASTRPRPAPAATAASPTTSASVGTGPGAAGTVSLADIVAQVATSPAPEDRSSSPRRAPATTSPAARAAPPTTRGAAGGAGGGGSPPGGGESTPAAGAPVPAPEPDPPATSPSTTATTPTTRPARTVATLDLPDFDFPDRRGTTRRDRR